MNTHVNIEVDKRTAEALETRAAELDRRYANASDGARVPHDRVVQWLRTWGTPGFRQWPGQ